MMIKPVYRFVGIDLGLANIGFCCLKYENGCLEIETALYFGTKLNKGAETAFQDLQHRLQQVVNFFRREVSSLESVLVVALEMFSYPRVPRKNGRSIIDPKATAQQAAVLGITQAIATEVNAPFVQIPARTAKKVVTGNNRASKEEVEAAVKALFQGFSDWPKSKQKRAHVADAVAVAYSAYAEKSMQEKIKFLDEFMACGTN